MNFCTIIKHYRSTQLSIMCHQFAFFNPRNSLRKGYNPASLITSCIIGVIFIKLWTANANLDPNFATDQVRTTIVQLFEWPWEAVEKECEWLGKNGFGAVQVSPPTENVVAVRGREYERWWEQYERPWWERYHPISYELYTRSGDEKKFKSMVEKCNSNNVRVYVDIVLNHMSGYFKPSNGTKNTTDTVTGNLTFPRTPQFKNNDFNGPQWCSSESGTIEDQYDISQVKYCKVDNTNDLYQARPEVRKPQTELLKKLTGMGVAGFRVAYARYMWPDDLEAIYKDVTLKAGTFPAGATPFYYHEVEDYVPGAAANNVNASDYYKIGRVTEFKVLPELGRIMRRNCTRRKRINSVCNTLHWLRDFGKRLGWVPSQFAVIFVDSQEKQREYGAYNFTEINFRYKRLYILATVFMLAVDYGIPRIMSSYKWTPFIYEGRDVRSWEGPPHDENFTVIAPEPKDDEGCQFDNKVDKSEWVCEHRWKPIPAMVKFRNKVNGTKITGQDYDGTKDQIAFSREEKGFFAMNNEDFPFKKTVYTSMPVGTYTDMINGLTITVKKDTYNTSINVIDLNIPERHDELDTLPFIAITL